MNFIPGSYAQIKIPTYEMDYDKDIDKSLIGEEYLPAWEKFGLFGLKCKNTEPTIRAYSMANYPGEKGTLTRTLAAVKQSLMAINAQINRWSRFDRKNYFYADLPQGYQISQLYHPIVGEGEIEVTLNEKDPDSPTKKIGIERIHVEQATSDP